VSSPRLPLRGILATAATLATHKAFMYLSTQRNTTNSVFDGNGPSHVEMFERQLLPQRDLEIVLIVKYM
jgi:hypothetical protein